VLSSGALLLQTGGVVLDAGLPPPKPTHWHVYVFTLGTCGRMIDIAPAACTLLMAVGAAASSPGKAGVVAIVSRSAPIFIYGIVTGAVAEADNMPAVVSLVLWLGLQAMFLYNCRFAALTSLVLITKSIADHAAKVEARWRKAHPAGGGRHKEKD
jgi:hypothetical protein